MTIIHLQRYKLMYKLHKYPRPYLLGFGVGGGRLERRDPSERTQLVRSLRSNSRRLLPRP